MKQIKKTVILFLLFILSSLFSFAQDDLLKMMEEEVPKQKEFTTATFKGTRLINFHTIETGGKRSLDFRIAHHFGDMNGGAYQFFGLDGGASIRLGLEYTYDGRLQFAIGRSSYEKTYDSFLKYRLLRQTTDNKMPVSMTLLSCMFYNTTKDPDKTINGYDRFQYASSRLSYAHQIIIARKFNEHLSLQVSPSLVHFNLVDGSNDKNTMYALAFAGRYKLTRRLAVTAEYAKRLTEFTSSTKYYDSVGLGFDIETGGHVFQVYVTNSFGLIENQFLPRTTSSVKDLAIKLGFNISRMFTI